VAPRLRFHLDWTRSDTEDMRRSSYERGVWVARHPVWGGLFIGGFYVLWMLLLPSIREPRLLTTPLWVALTFAGGAASGVTMVLYLRRKHPPPSARSDETP
jgi:hypothetical protein